MHETIKITINAKMANGANFFITNRFLYIIFNFIIFFLLQKYNLFTEHLNFDIETFIKKHINDNKNTLAFKLKANKQTNYNANLVLETLINYKKALYKVPIYALNYCWLPTKSYEQCSNELTSFYKSSFFISFMKNCL